METKKQPDIKARSRLILFGTVSIFFALLVFHIGVVVGSTRGFHDAMLDRGFQHPLLPSSVHLPRGYVPDGHGAVGSVTSVALPQVTLEMRDGSVRTLMVASSTHLEDRYGENSLESLSPGTHVIVLGEPGENGEIDARLIRVVATSTK